MNKKYETAVKVSLKKCLRFLVVDTVASSKYVTEFLKEKQIQKDVLILENMPEVQQAVMTISNLRLREMGGEYISEVIDVTKKNNGQVQRAVDYFVKGKIVCSDFDVAVKLQREGGCKNLVTLDGTEFKAGMISGGQNS